MAQISHTKVLLLEDPFPSIHTHIQILCVPLDLIFPTFPQYYSSAVLFHYSEIRLQFPQEPLHLLTSY